MITIAVQCPDTGKELWHRLQEDLAHLDPEDAPQIRCSVADRQTIITCRFADAEPARNVQIYYIASSLTDLIVSHYEQGILRRLIRKDHASAPRDELEAILKETLEMLAGRSPAKSADNIRLQTKADIMYTLLDYLSAEKLLILEGFVRFRLWKYRNNLRRLIGTAAESVRRKRAHREFVALLKNFVELQPPQTDIVHVIVRPNGLYQILNRDFSAIETEYLQGHMAGLIEHELDVEDLLISALLNIAPLRIRLHFPRKWPVTDAVETIFAGRAAYCTGCRYCEESRKAIATILANRAKKS
ncbi:MAG TPA: hypothetical protein GXX47_07755 [Firmicutes bacterium]|nr:hypothetical protein [Bacillota bacterium]